MRLPTLLDEAEPIVDDDYESAPDDDDAEEAEPPAVVLARRLDVERAEFVDGRVQERTVGALSEAVGSELHILLGQHVHARKLGRVFGSNMPFRCFPHDATRMRKPDISFIVAERVTAELFRESELTIAPDLAIEIISPHDKYVEIEEKVVDYRLAGVKLIWIVNPGTKSVLIRRLDRTCAEIDGDATLDGEAVVPGFTLALSRLFV